MKRQGYTLVEVMAAVLVLGIASTALLQGIGVLRLNQGRTAERIEAGRALARARGALGRLLDRPYRRSIALEERLSGDQDVVTLQCDSPPCELRLEPAGTTPPVLVARTGVEESRHVLRGLRNPVFRYQTAETELDHWPLAPPNRQRLVALGIVDIAKGVVSPVATVRVWAEQPHDCMFDSISSKCRPPLP